MITIGEDIPSDYCVWTNAHALARYAALSQEAGLVPIVEPEVLMDGDHTIERSFDVTSRTLHAVFTELRDQRVALRGHAAQAEHGALRQRVPDAGRRATRSPSRRSLLPSPRARGRARHRLPLRRPVRRGGDSAPQRDERADGPHPWQLSYSYGRALQAPALKAWGGDTANAEAAQAAYLHRARMNGLARSGDYSPELEKAVAA